MLVSLGGDVATAGPAPPAAGGPRHRDHAPGPARRGSGSRCAAARWRRRARACAAGAGGRIVHHIVDPSTGEPASRAWRTVERAAASCVDANTASTAAIVRGADAPAWLESLGLPARLVDPDGAVVHVGAWPRDAA